MHADPSTIIRPGLKKINTSQLIPRTSNELKENCEEYALLKDALQPIFEWQANVVFILVFFILIVYLLTYIMGSFRRFFLRNSKSYRNLQKLFPVVPILQFILLVALF